MFIGLELGAIHRKVYLVLVNVGGTVGARAHFLERLERVDAGRMSVAPSELHRIAADKLNIKGKDIIGYLD